MFVSNVVNLVLNDINDECDIFVYDCLIGIMEWVSLGDDGSEVNNILFDMVFLVNGWFVVFGSSVSNLVEGDMNGCSDIFVCDCCR